MTQASFFATGLLNAILAFIILPLGVTHIARLEELLVHSQCAAECVRGMSSLRHLQVLVQQWAVLWIHTVVDDLVSALDRALTAQVSNTVLGDDNLHRVLAMVVVANHRQECGDSTTLSGRRSSINPNSDYFASIKNSPHQFNK